MKRCHFETAFCICVFVGLLGNYGMVTCKQEDNFCVKNWTTAADGSFKAAAAIAVYLAKPPTENQ